MAPQRPTPRQTRNSRVLRPLSPGLALFSASAFFDQKNRQISSQQSAISATAAESTSFDPLPTQDTSAQAAQVHETPDNLLFAPTPRTQTTPLPGSGASVSEPIVEDDGESKTPEATDEGQLDRSFYEADGQSVLSSESPSLRNSNFQGDNAFKNASSPGDDGISISPSPSDGSNHFISATDSHQSGDGAVDDSHLSQSNRGDPTLLQGESRLPSIERDEDHHHTKTDHIQQHNLCSATTSEVEGCQAQLDQVRRAHDLAQARVAAAQEQYEYYARRAGVLPLDINAAKAPHPRFWLNEEHPQFVQRSDKEGLLFAARLYRSILEDHRVRGCICGAPTIYPSRAEAEVGKGHLRFYVTSPNQPGHLCVLQVRGDTVWHCICSHTSLYETYPRKRKADDDELDLVRQNNLANQGSKPATNPEAEGREAVEPQEAAASSTRRILRPLRRLLQPGQDLAIRSYRLLAYMTGTVVALGKAAHGKARAMPSSVAATCGRMCRDIPEFFTVAGDVVEIRRKSPETQQIVVKRLKRQICLPADEEERKAAEAEIARIKQGLLFYEWAENPQQHIGANLVASIYQGLKTQVEAINAQRVSPALSIERLVATMPPGEELSVSMAIYHFMMDHCGGMNRDLGTEHNLVPFWEALGAYKKGLQNVMAFMRDLYDPASVAFAQAKAESEEPTTIPAFRSYGVRTQVRIMAEFLRWFMTLKGHVFDMPGHVEEAFFKIYVDAKAVHKKEAPPSWVVTPGMGHNGIPGTFPGDDNRDDMYEEVPVDELTFDPGYAVRFPASESSTAKEGGRKPGKYKTIRPRRGVLRCPTEEFPLNGWMPTGDDATEQPYAGGSGTFVVPPGTPERVRPGRTFTVPYSPDSPETPEQSGASATPPRRTPKASPAYIPKYSVRRLERRPRQKLAFQKEITLFTPPRRIPVRVTSTRRTRPRRIRIAPTKFLDGADAEFLKKPSGDESEDEDDFFPLPGSIRNQDFDNGDEAPSSSFPSEEAESATGVHGPPQGDMAHHGEVAATAEHVHDVAALTEQEVEAEDHAVEAANQLPGRPRSPDGVDTSGGDKRVVVSAPQRKEPYHEDEFTDLLVEMHDEIRGTRDYRTWERPFEREQREMRRRQPPAKMVEERRRQIDLFFEDREIKDSGIVGPRGTLAPRESLGIASSVLEENEIDNQLKEDTMAGLERKLQEALRIDEARKQDEKARMKAAEELRQQQERQRKKAEQQRVKDQETKRLRLAAAERGFRLPKRPLVTPMSQEWEDRVDAAAALPPNTKLGVTPEPADFEARDLVEKLLPPTAWLNDTIIIGSVLSAAAAVNKATGATAADPKCAALTSYFWPRLVSSGPTSCGRLMKRANIRADNFLGLDSILVPICEGNHWTLAVVRPRLRQVAHMDSLRGGRGDPATRARLMGWVRATLGPRFDEAEWREVDLPSPRQTNGWDCGVFTIANAICVGMGVEPTEAYAPAELTAMRRRLAAALLNGGFEGEFGLADL